MILKKNSWENVYIFCVCVFFLFNFLTVLWNFFQLKKLENQNNIVLEVTKSTFLKENNGKVELNKVEIQRIELNENKVSKLK